MADSADTTSVPVKVPEPEGHAPPTLAEPASGPVAEMSGALPHDDKKDAAASAGANIQASMNGTSTLPLRAEPEKPVEPSTQATSDAPADTQDTEMKDAAGTDGAQDESQATADTNGTQSDKKTPNSKRKSTGGVPEHKNKKLNKKKSMQKITHLDAQPGDYYFARLKSYPPWPSIICDEDMLPTSLLNTRPVTTKKADGTYNEAYAEGGKKVAERTYPVMFLFTNEFAWIPNTDLNPFSPEECKDVTEKGKTKSLIQAYNVAAEGHDLQHYKDMLLDHAKALQEDEDAKEAKAAEKAAKADKKKRKSDVKAAEPDVEMEDAETASAKKSSKKRKKDAESEDEAPEKPAKTPKTTKLKLTTNKTPNTTEKKAKEPKSAKPKSDKKKKAATSDEEMQDAEEKVEEKPLDPAEEREARKKEVLFLRHKLQKGFLSRDQAPREDEMPQMNNYIKKLEVYPDLEVAIIRETKINKVLKALVKLNSIPRDEEFQFRKRSVDLLGKWNKILGAEPAEGGDQDDKGPSTNGVHDDKKDDGEDAKEKTSETSEPAEKTSTEAQDTDAKASSTAEKDTPSEQPKTNETPAQSKESETKTSTEDTKKDDAPSHTIGEVVDKAVDKTKETVKGAAEAVVQAVE